MADHVGLVLNTLENRTAEVATARRDFCGGCTDARNCRMCLAGARCIETVQNRVGAGQGDVVAICLEDHDLYAGSLLPYIIPALWLMTGAMIGYGLGGDWKIGPNGGAVLLGLSGFAIGLMMIALVSRLLKFALKTAPRILRVIERSPEGLRKFQLLEPIPVKQV